MTQTQTLVASREAVMAAVAAQAPRLLVDAQAVPELAVLVGVQGPAAASCTEANVGQLLAQSGVGPLWRYVLLRGWGAAAVVAVLTQYRLVAADLDVVTLTRH
ncbi:hypothetical protein [Lacticaseibacillus suihuaensis]